MEKIITLLLLFVLSIPTFGQGSGATLNFDGANDFVQLPSVITNGSGSSTVEMWVKVPTVGTGGLRARERVGVLLGNYNSSPNRNYEIHSKGQCRIWWNNGQVDTRGTTDLRDNTWHHLAFVRDLSGTTNFYIYIDGILEHTNTSTGDNIVLTTPSRIGGDNRNASGGPSFHGQIDEIRIWSDARSQAEIREYMCQKLSGTEANLTHYYRFDDNAGTTLTDVVGGNHGTLTNMVIPTWTLSGAPIGDVSTHLYTPTWTGQTINLTSSNRGNLEVNTVTGTPRGIQIYRVDGVPNSTADITPSLGSSNIYYGTFIIGGTSPSYTVQYDYTNYSDAILAEPNLLLYNRNDNSDLTWADISATVNTGTNTLTEIGINYRGEFIVAGSLNPLPIKLISFRAYVVENNLVQLDWQTATEINNHFFTIERSKNGIDWEEVVKVGAMGNSSTLSNYTKKDRNPYLGISYYRLKQTDFDGQFFYSDMKSVTLNQFEDESVEIYSNPSENIIYIAGNLDGLEQIKIFNYLGQDATNLTEIVSKNKTRIVISLFGLSPGVYYIKTKNTVNKVYKQ